MGIGIGLGASQRAIGDIELRRIERERLGLEGARFSFEEQQRRREMAGKAIDDLAAQAANVVKNLREQADASGVPQEEIQPKIEELISTISSRAQSLAETSGVIDPQTVSLRFQGILLSLTPEQQRQLRANQAREEAAARAEGTRSASPISLGTRIISSDDPLNEQLGLNIPPGEAARVELLRNPDGTITANARGRFGEGQKIEIFTERSAFERQRAKDLASSLDAMIQEGRNAVVMEQNLRQLAQLIRDVQTGRGQPTLTAIQGLAKTFGFDLSAIAKKVGVKLGPLAKQEEFDRIAKQIIIDGFAKFKGNLNPTEIELAITAFQNLGRSKEANEEAIAASLAAVTLSRRRGIEAAKINTEAESRALLSELIANDVTEFLRLKEQFIAELRGSSAETPEGLPAGSIAVGRLPSGETVYKTPDGQHIARK